MYSLIVPIRKSFNWWFHLCTGRSEFDRTDEEHYRQRILVMTCLFWLLLVMIFSALVPVAMELAPEAQFVVNAVFAATVVAAVLSMLVLRLLGNRLAAVNVLLSIYASAFAAACFYFGGTQSPTYPLLILVPAMAGLTGNIALSVVWGLLTLFFWVGVLQAERSGFEFMQVYPPSELSLAMMMTYVGLAFAVVIIITIYSETTRALRQKLLTTNSELEHLSSHDQLTRLPNRRFYDERITLALRRATENRGMTGLLFIDLNEFKKINDTYGHGAGDKLLIAVAQRVQANLRETDLVARLGGDEFVAVLEDVKSPDEVTRIAHKLSQAIEQPLYVRQQILKFSASIGVAIFPIDGRQQQELEEKADKAMYMAKKRGLPVALASLEPSNVPTPARAPVHRI